MTTMFYIIFMIACSKSESQVCKDTCDQEKMGSDTITSEYQTKWDQCLIEQTEAINQLKELVGQMSKEARSPEKFKEIENNKKILSETQLELKGLNCDTGDALSNLDCLILQGKLTTKIKDLQGKIHSWESDIKRYDKEDERLKIDSNILAEEECLRISENTWKECRQECIKTFGDQ